MFSQFRQAGLIIWLLSSLLLASPTTASPVVSDEATLIRLSNEWMAAIEQKDRPSLERIVASEFTLRMPGDAQHLIVRRDEWLANAIGKDWSKFSYENLEAGVNGDQAIVTSRLQFDIAPFPLTLDSGVVDVWRKRDGRWQVTHRYLGESRVQLRIAFVAGILIAIIAGLAVYLGTRLIRRRRLRAA